MNLIKCKNVQKCLELYWNLIRLLDAQKQDIISMLMVGINKTKQKYRLMKYWILVCAQIEKKLIVFHYFFKIFCCFPGVHDRWYFHTFPALSLTVRFSHTTLAPIILLSVLAFKSLNSRRETVIKISTQKPAE